MKDSVKQMFLKTRKILTKACKGIQYSEKLYTTIMKPLLPKLIPLQVPRSSCKNFQFQQQLYSSTYHLLKKVPPGLMVINFRKCSKALLNGCFSNHCRKELLCSFLLKSGITENSLFVVCVVLSCISHGSGKVLLIGKVLPINFL